METIINTRRSQKCIEVECDAIIAAGARGPVAKRCHRCTKRHTAKLAGAPRYFEVRRV